MPASPLAILLIGLSTAVVAGVSGPRMGFELHPAGSVRDGAFGFPGVAGSHPETAVEISGVIAWDVANDNVIEAHGLASKPPWSSFLTAFPAVAAEGKLALAGAYRFRIATVSGDWFALLEAGPQNFGLSWDVEYLELGSEADPVATASDDVTRVYNHVGVGTGYFNRWFEATGSPSSVIERIWLRVELDSFDPLQGATGTFAFLARAPGLSVASQGPAGTVTIEEELGLPAAEPIDNAFVGTGGEAEGDDRGALVALPAQTRIVNAAGLSGLMFSPALDGEGYNIVVTPSGTIIYFYGYTQGGQRLWLISELYTGEWAVGRTVRLNMLEGMGGTFERPAEPPGAFSQWGTIAITFNSCNTARIELDGVDGSKTVVAAQRLAGIDGVLCDRQ